MAHHEPGLPHGSPRSQVQLLGESGSRRRGGRRPASRRAGASQTGGDVGDILGGLKWWGRGRSRGATLVSAEAGSNDAAPATDSDMAGDEKVEKEKEKAQEERILISEVRGWEATHATGLP